MAKIFAQTAKGLARGTAGMVAGLILWSAQSGGAAAQWSAPDPTAAWPNTDFSTATVDLSEVRSGGVPRDAIPAIDAPEMIEARAETALDPREPVVTVVLDGARARAYPLRYLTWHEIVNDEIDGRSIAVTYCPLCNSAMVFDARVGDAVLRFGVSGNLRHSDMIMFDRQTESWWQQALGEGIAGVHAGVQLEALPAWMESWQSFLVEHPDGEVMAEPQGYRRPYGQNPYQGYDRSDWPFLYSGEAPPHGIDPLARVVRVGDRAWPLARLAQAGEIAEAGVVLRWRGEMASPLDTGAIAEGREISEIRVQDAAGADLAHDVLFAFAFHAFWPEGHWMLAP